jgi:septal ring factor EnvC (AmiA/AmiB activator)
VDINARRQEIIAQVGRMNQELQQHQQAIANLQQEGLRLEGEFRLLEQLGAEEAQRAAKASEPEAGHPEGAAGDQGAQSESGAPEGEGAAA